MRYSDSVSTFRSVVSVQSAVSETAGRGVAWMAAISGGSIDEATAHSLIVYVDEPALVRLEERPPLFHAQAAQ